VYYDSMFASLQLVSGLNFVYTVSEYQIGSLYMLTFTLIPPPPATGSFNREVSAFGFKADAVPTSLLN
jgi:hypothetical protein